MSVPHEGLTHLTDYKVEGSNVEFIGSDIDHKVKYASAATEPAWQAKGLGSEVGVRIWRIEDFEVITWPKEQYGAFFDGDSYIILSTYKLEPEKPDSPLRHDIHFWLGEKTSQDEAGTAAYKTVELDEFLHGAATQYRELQSTPSSRFLSLFPRLTILRGGVKSGFNHVVPRDETTFRLLQITAASASARAGVIVKEVEPKVESLNAGDVFVLDEGKTVSQWQGERASPMEKAKAAQAMHDMILERSYKVETTVSAQTDSRSFIFLRKLGGDENTRVKPAEGAVSGRARRAASASYSSAADGSERPRKLLRISDASGQLKFEPVGEGKQPKSAFKSDDVYLYDTPSQIYVWQGKAASKTERAMWLKVAQHYLRSLASDAQSTPIAKVLDGAEPAAFVAALS